LRTGAWAAAAGRTGAGGAGRGDWAWGLVGGWGGCGVPDPAMTTRDAQRHTVGTSPGLSGCAPTAVSSG
jgi:hypothetical protein